MLTNGPMLVPNRCIHLRLLAWLQLGLGDSGNRNVPCQVSIDGCLPKNVACGWWHTLLLAERPL